MYKTTDKTTPKLEPVRMEEILPQAIKDNPTMPIEEIKKGLKKAIQEEYDSKLRIFNNPRGV